METQTPEVSASTNWPGSNIARVIFSVPPENGRIARKLASQVLLGQGFSIDGAMGKPIRTGVYLVAVSPLNISANPR